MVMVMVMVEMSRTRDKPGESKTTSNGLWARETWSARAHEQQLDEKQQHGVQVHLRFVGQLRRHGSAKRLLLGWARERKNAWWWGIKRGVSAVESGWVLCTCTSLMAPS